MSFLSDLEDLACSNTLGSLPCGQKILEFFPHTIHCIGEYEIVVAQHANELLKELWCMEHLGCSLHHGNEAALVH